MRAQATDIDLFVTIGAQAIVTVVDARQGHLNVTQRGGRARQMNDIRLALCFGAAVVIGFISVPGQAGVVAPMFTVTVQPCVNGVGRCLLQRQQLAAKLLQRGGIEGAV